MFAYPWFAIQNLFEILMWLYLKIAQNRHKFFDRDLAGLNFHRLQGDGGERTVCFCFSEILNQFEYLNIMITNLHALQAVPGPQGPQGPPGPPGLKVRL